MADVPIDGDAPAAGAPQSGLTQVMVAVSALRRGLPTMIAGSKTTGPALVMAAAETIDAALLARFAADADGRQTVVLSNARARELSGLATGGLAGDGLAGDRPAAVSARDGAFDLVSLRALADPTLPQDLPPLVMAPAPASAGAALALLKQAGLLPAAIILTGGTSDPALDGPVTRAEDILAYTAQSAAALVKVSEAVVPIGRMADCRMIVFRAPGTGRDHLAILLGRPETVAEPLVRVHSECFTGDLLGSLRCDCGAQLQGAIERIAAEGAGAVLYLAQEGRGIGMANKLRAYTLQDRGLDTLDANRALGFDADERDFAVAAAMLRQLGLTRIRLLTNNPAKLAALAQHGVDVAGRVSLRFAANGVNDAYLATKMARFGHMLDEAGEP